MCVYIEREGSRERERGTGARGRRAGDGPLTCAIRSENGPSHAQYVDEVASDMCNTFRKWPLTCAVSPPWGKYKLAPGRRGGEGQLPKSWPGFGSAYGPRVTHCTPQTTLGSQSMRHGEGDNGCHPRLATPKPHCRQAGSPGTCLLEYVFAAE